MFPKQRESLMEEQEKETKQKESENSSTLKEPAEAQSEKQAEQPEEKTDDIQAGNIQLDNAQQEEPASTQPENQTGNKQQTLEVPLFSEATADFLMRSQSPEDVHQFMSGTEYSLPYLSRKLLFSAWDKYCDNFHKLILPAIFFAMLEAIPVGLLIFSKSMLAVFAITVLLLAPAQIGKNLFFLYLISGSKNPFPEFFTVFASFRFYAQSICVVSVFFLCVFCGISLMVLPGYIFYVLFSLSLYFAADEHLGIKASFKLAFAGSRGYRFFIGTVFVLSMILQSLIPGIFAIEIAENTINASIAPGIWNFAGFAIYSLVIAPMIQIINAGIYLEAKQSIFNTVSRILSRMGQEGNITIKEIIPDEKIKQNPEDKNNSGEDNENPED